MPIFSDAASAIFIDQDMRMNPSLSTDGVHLNENGYNLWVQNTMDLITSLENNLLGNSIINYDFIKDTLDWYIPLYETINFKIK